MPFVVVVVCGGGCRAKFCRADGLHSIVDDDDGSDDYVDWPGDGSNDGTGPPWWADAHDWLALFLSPTACVAYVALALVGVAVAAYRYRYGITLLGFGPLLPTLFVTRDAAVLQLFFVFAGI